MTDRPIPKSIMDEARLLASDAVTAYQNGRWLNEGASPIAKALMAERERAARIARERAERCSDLHAEDFDEYWLGGASSAEMIANAILSEEP